MGQSATSDSGKIPVERLRQDDVVRAVEHGPLGRVVDPDRYGWTLVAWLPESRVLPYEHGKDRLYLIEAA